jgi:hypothetical protein
MVDMHEARQIAFHTAQSQCPFAIEIIDVETREESFGWVFFYQRAEPPHGLVGNAPIIVDRETGRPSVTGTNYPIDWYIQAYRELGQDRFDAREWRQFIQVAYLNTDDVDE